MVQCYHYLSFWEIVIKQNNYEIAIDREIWNLNRMKCFVPKMEKNEKLSYVEGSQHLTNLCIFHGISLHILCIGHLVLLYPTINLKKKQIIFLYNWIELVFSRFSWKHIKPYTLFIQWYCSTTSIVYYINVLWYEKCRPDVLIDRFV